MMTQTTPHDSPGTSLTPKDVREIRSGSPPTGAPKAGGGQNRRLSTNNRLYLENSKK